MEADREYEMEQARRQMTTPKAQEMTLRDHFAALAMSGMFDRYPRTAYQAEDFEDRARVAYKMADALLRARALAVLAILALALLALGCSEPGHEKDPVPVWNSTEDGVTCEGAAIVATSTTDHIAITCSWPCGARVEFYAQPHVQFFPLLEEACP